MKGWSSYPASHHSACTSLRALLSRNGIKPAVAATYTTHSLKATTFSWCAKYGLSLETRRLL
eukprot:5688927-Amphidinium_carterae.1